MCRPIRVRDDQVSFQQDLLALKRWGDPWGMQFNVEKCYIMHITRRNSPLTNFYTFCNQVLLGVDDVKYLGVNLTSELSWSPHIDHNTHRANSTLGFLKRNLKKCPSKLKETAYLLLCRFVLEYAASIWDPFLFKDKDSLERVQRRAARFVCVDYKTTSSITSILARVGWKNLQDRKRELRLALLY